MVYSWKISNHCFVFWSLHSTKGNKEKEDKEKTAKEKKEKKEKNPANTPEAKAGAKDKPKEEKVIDGKEKTPKADKDKRKEDKKEEKSKNDGKSAEKERDVSNDSKTKESVKVEKSAAAGPLKSPVPRSEGLESERGKTFGKYTCCASFMSHVSAALLHSRTPIVDFIPFYFVKLQKYDWDAVSKGHNKC